MTEKTKQTLYAVLFIISGVVVLELIVALELVEKEFRGGFIYSLAMLWLVVGLILIVRGKKKKIKEDYETKQEEINYYNKLKN